MFSQKLICAIRIIEIIAESSLHETGRKQGMNAMRLQKEIGVETTVFRTVKALLVREGIIGRIAGRLVLNKDAAKVSLLDLMKILHSGLPLGGLVETSWGKGSYLFDGKYEPLRELEKQAEAELAERLEQIRVLEIIGSPCAEVRKEKR